MKNQSEVYMKVKIHSRRYLGNKYKLLPFIKEIVEQECNNVNIVFDVFAGTGCVSSAFLDKTLITNDILKSNYFCHLTWFSPQKYDASKIQTILNIYNKISSIKEDNYMSENFADTFFSYNVCKKIGYIRDDIEDKYINKEINLREKAILITSLLYAIDKIANTCGHYDAYIKGKEFPSDFLMLMPEIQEHLSKDNRCFNMDANELSKTINCDLAYLDPPYNSRQYCDTYHLLENIARWEKPVVSGITRKMDRSLLKSDFCTTKAAESLEQLVMNLKCKYILLSYNNTGRKLTPSSNARISDEKILEILEKKGTVKIFSKKHTAFTTGKSKNHGNEERFFLCIVNEKNNFKHEKNNFKQSPLNYVGGKYKLLPQIYPKFPTNINTFVDLFCGGCNVGINVNANKYWYNDINAKLIGLYNTIYNLEKNDILDTIHSIIFKYNLSLSKKYGHDIYKYNKSKGLSTYNKANYKLLKNDFNNMDTSDKFYYLTLYVLIVYGFNNQIRFNKSGGFNTPVGKGDFNKRLEDKLINFIDELKLQKPIFTNLDFRTFDISQFNNLDFIYIDPPYLISTACYNENGGWTEQDEIDLLSFIDKLHKNNIRFALSNVIEHKGKTNHILLKWLEDNKNIYTTHYLDFSYSNSNYQKKDKVTKSKEVLITNY